MTKPLLVLAVLLLALTGPVHAQAINPFESNFDAQLDALKERVFFYQNNYPTLTIPEDLLSGRLAAMGSSATPMTAQRKLLALTTKLDRTVLAFLKKEIHNVGSRVGTDPTSRANFERRKFMILEFAAILKRQRIPMVVYFPKGERDLMLLGMGGADAVKVTDALLASLATKLKDDVPSKPARGGGGAGGGGESGGGGSGGLSGAAIDPVPAGGGGLSGFEDAPPTAAPPAPPRPAPPSESEASWIERFKLIVGAGVVAVVVCSLLALLLPRVRAGMFAMLQRMGGRAEALTPPMEDDLLKKGMLALNRGDYKRALQMLEKVKSPMKALEVTYHRAICHIRLLETEAAAHQLAMIELDRTGLDELFRLGLACEESRMLEWAVRLFEHVERTDPSFRGVAQKLGRLKKELA